MTQEQETNLRNVLYEMDALRSDVVCLHGTIDLTDTTYLALPVRLRIIARARLILHILWRTLR